MLPESLSDQGVWIRRHFLPDELRREILASADRSRHEPLKVLRRNVGEVMDTDVRNSKVVDIDPTLAADLDARVGSLMSEFFFDGESVQQLPFQKVLCYEPGGFFRAHLDDHPTPFGPNQSLVGHRKRIVLVGLTPSEEYDGGELELFGLLDGPFADCGVPIKIPAGSAVSFRAHVIHAVRPVTRGKRYIASGAFGLVTPAEPSTISDQNRSNEP